MRTAAGPRLADEPSGNTGKNRTCPTRINAYQRVSDPFNAYQTVRCKRLGCAVNTGPTMTQTSERLDPLELITVKELAALAKRSRTSLYDDIKTGKLRAVRLGSSVRIPRVEAERYLTSGTN